MTDTTKQLVERLRDRASKLPKAERAMSDATLAADALEAKDAEIARLRAEKRALLPVCAVTGAIPGDGGACGDCDPCIMGEVSIPAAVKRLIAEKNSLLDRICDLEGSHER